MKVEFVDREYFGNINIGGVFEYNGALLVALPYDWTDECYKGICIKGNDVEFDRGETYKFDANEVVTECKIIG